MPADDSYTVIEPCAGETYAHDGRWGVYRYSTYPDSSVLAGQERRQYLDDFASPEEAKASYPDAESSEGSNYRPPHIPDTPPAWFDPSAIGESWDGE
jgi:hypothetical protein